MQTQETPTEETPKNEEEYINQSSTCLNDGRWEEALEYINKAISINPKSANSYHLRSMIFEVLDRFEEALSDLDRIIQLQPGDIHAYFKKGEINQKLHKHVPAIEAFTKSLELGGTLDHRIFRSRSYFTIGEYQKALEDLKVIQEYIPNDPDFFSETCQCYMMMRDYTKSLENFNTALKISRTRDEEKEKEQAKEKKATEKSFEKTAQIYENMGRLYIILGDDDIARENFTRAKEAFSTQKGSSSGLCFIKLMQDDIKEAEEYLETAINYEGGRNRYFLKAYIFAKTNNLKTGDEKIQNQLKEILKAAVSEDEDGIVRRWFKFVAENSKIERAKEISEQILQLLYHFPFYLRFRIHSNPVNDLTFSSSCWRFFKLSNN